MLTQQVNAEAREKGLLLENPPAPIVRKSLTAKVSFLSAPSQKAKYILWFYLPPEVSQALGTQKLSIVREGSSNWIIAPDRAGHLHISKRSEVGTVNTKLFPPDLQTFGRSPARCEIVEDHVVIQLDPAKRIPVDTQRASSWKKTRETRHQEIVSQNTESASITKEAPLAHPPEAGFVALDASTLLPALSNQDDSAENHPHRESKDPNKTQEKQEKQEQPLLSPADMEKLCRQALPLIRRIYTETPYRLSVHRETGVISFTAPRID